MDTKIEGRIGIKASSDAIWELISDLSSWDRWNTYETGLEGMIAFGGQIALNEAFPDVPARRVTARVGEWQPQARLVWAEKRGWAFNVTRYFEIEELIPGSCIVANGMIFSGLRGEWFHDKHRPQLKPALAEIGEGLRAAAEG